MPERRNVGTIREIVSWAQADGLPLTEYGLRLLVRQGKIPVRRIGAKQLVPFSAVREFLFCQNGQENLPGGVGCGA